MQDAIKVLKQSIKKVEYGTLSLKFDPPVQCVAILTNFNGDLVLFEQGLELTPIWAPITTTETPLEAVRQKLRGYMGTYSALHRTLDYDDRVVGRIMRAVSSGIVHCSLEPHRIICCIVVTIGSELINAMIDASACNVKVRKFGKFDNFAPGPFHFFTTSDVMRSLIRDAVHRYGAQLWTVACDEGPPVVAQMWPNRSQHNAPTAKDDIGKNVELLARIEVLEAQVRNTNSYLNAILARLDAICIMPVCPPAPAAAPASEFLPAP
jgi:hypothetical protein